ncbi:hypothetical protein C0995_012277 [Termitomyces sp. Mi166|nr:hypothetical protein C0995_012277 [Termitomyces sp. Mi166\
MSLHRGTGVSILQLSCLSLLSIVEAFKLSNPPSTFPGDSLAISWTSSPGDPKDFDLEVGFCEDLSGPLLFEQTAIDTQASSLRHASIPKSLPSGLEPPASCSVRAFDS